MAAGDEEDPKGLFTDNVQNSAREEGLKREEEAGRLKFLCYSNDGVDEHMIWLVGLKNIFARLSFLICPKSTLSVSLWIELTSQ